MAEHKPVDLRIVEGLDQAFEPHDEPPLATANNAVPLLWLALFDYEDAAVRKAGALDVFSAVTPLERAAERAEVLCRALPRSSRVLSAAALCLQRALARHHARLPASGHLVVYPQALFEALSAGAARTYLKQLVNLCDLWERLREGRPWGEVRTHLERISPEIGQALAQPDEELLRYYLLGSLADTSELEHFLIAEGQQKADVEPEALAVGDQGLLVGRYNGTWKLIDSGCDQDLFGVWAEGTTAYAVGRGGTVLCLDQGKCAPVEVPTTQKLNAVWGLGTSSVCVVGDQGTVLAYNGKHWQPWPVPTHAPLHCVWGSEPENVFICGQEAAVLRFDGYAWNRMPLPVEGFVNDLSGADHRVYAAGGSRRGGEIFRLGRDGWIQDKSLPNSEWLEGLWTGWDGELGVVPRTGRSLCHDGARWLSEPVPASELVAAAGGALPMAVGVKGDYTVILRRDQGVWELEATLQGLRLYDVWVGGSPKPQRLPLDSPDPEPSTTP